MADLTLCENALKENGPFDKKIRNNSIVRTNRLYFANEIVLCDLATREINSKLM